MNRLAIVRFLYDRLSIGVNPDHLLVLNIKNSGEPIENNLQFEVEPKRDPQEKDQHLEGDH